MPPAETAPDGPPAGRSAEPAAGPPVDYAERVYAGVLGKIIAVCLGRPFEGWSHQKILDELGEITCYVNDRHDVALKHHLLVVPDDDISGTFVFPRSLRDHGLDPTPEQVGQTWLNELIEDKTVLWWGGLGNSTEHTAYLRLLAGETPPDTGSAARNGVVVSEQVGAQIFIEGFAMTCPGDPEKAADLAER
ncbi:MAG: ADP-ribosylglycohydrolase family protein, partial [Micromonosporaceae bacterium]